MSRCTETGDIICPEMKASTKAACTLPTQYLLEKISLKRGLRMKA